MLEIGKDIFVVYEQSVSLEIQNRMSDRMISKKRVSIFLGLFLSMCLVACGGGGGSDDNSDNDSSNINACSELGFTERSLARIIGGQKCNLDQSSPIVRIAVLVNDADRTLALPICTGAMLTNDIVLTAAHCLEAPELQDLTVVGFGILMGPAESLRYVNGSETPIYPGFFAEENQSSSRLLGDLALIRLEQEISTRTLPVLNSRSPSAGETGLVYGFGVESLDTDNQIDDFLDLKAGTMKIEDLTPNHIFVRYSGNGANVCFGDSGGPLLLKTEQGYAIAGIVSQGSDQDCSKGDVTTYTNLAGTAQGDWIFEIAPTVAQY